MDVSKLKRKRVVIPVAGLAAFIMIGALVPATPDTAPATASRTSTPAPTVTVTQQVIAEPTTEATTDAPEPTTEATTDAPEPTTEATTDAPEPTVATSEEATATATDSTTPVPAVVAPAPKPKAVAKAAPKSKAATVFVTYVVDGDTVQVTGGARIRVVGIDTPERGQCGYLPAAQHMRALTLGKAVNLVTTGKTDKDRYGRLLRYVDVNGKDAGLSQITTGLAIARYDSRDGYGSHPREAAYIKADAASANVNICATKPVPFVKKAAPKATAPAPAPVPAVPSAVYYANCTAVRAAGAAPIHPSDPGWQPKFDRDKDGVGCDT